LADNSTRQIKLTVDSGGDQLTPVRLDAFEAMSLPFRISLDVLSTLGEIKLLPYLGKSVMVESQIDGVHQRYFHGIISDAHFLEDLDGKQFLYRFMLSPRAQFHEQGRDFRIFQDMSVIETVKQVLQDRKIAFDVLATTGTRKRTFCVQYGESDFAFVSRLMEEEGLYYFYEHTSTEHKLVICDGPSCHANLKFSDLTYNPLSAGIAYADSAARHSSQANVYVQSWQEHVSSGAETTVSMRDFNFMEPQQAIKASVIDERVHQAEDLKFKDDKIEYYAWPGRHYTDQLGADLAKYLLESRRAQRRRFESSSQFTKIQTGHVFGLKGHPNDSYNKNYLVIHCHTSLADENFRSGGGIGETLVEFAVIPADFQFRAPMVTRRPIVSGPETAVVTGPPGEEIHVDKYGRIKVHFHWDRLGKEDDTCSCWIRVAQTGGLGNIIIPRVGDEVLISFINGDPDRPIVVGRVFNESHMAYYELPEHKTRALWRSKTYKRTSGGPWSGAKDLASLPHANRPVDSELDGTPMHGNELRFEDKEDEEHLVVYAERDLDTRVRNNETHLVGKDEFIDIGNDRTVTIQANDILDVTEKITVTSGTEISITAESKITLTVGESSITIDASSIKISTPTLDMKGMSKADLAAPMTTVKADGILTLQGSMVKIN
jgi:type VI secretion system secreted protein VgrG